MRFSFGCLLGGSAPCEGKSPARCAPPREAESQGERRPHGMAMLRGCTLRAGAAARSRVDAPEVGYCVLAIERPPVPRYDEARPVVRRCPFALREHRELRLSHRLRLPGALLESLVIRDHQLLCRSVVDLPQAHHLGARP